MPERRFKIALIGFGYFARFHLEGWCRLTPEVDLIAVIERDHQRRDEAVTFAREFGIEIDAFENFTDFKETLGDQKIDLLDLATPPPTHGALIRQAFDVTDAIVCQKPFCTDLFEARTITTEAESLGSGLYVHENFRFQPWHLEIKKLIQSGRLGEIVQAEFRFRPGDGGGEDAYLARQPYFRDMPQFLIRETGVHYIDLFRFLFDEPVSVFADLYRTNPVISGEDSGSFCFILRDGARIRFDGNRTLDHAATNRRLTMGDFLIEGRQASLKLNGDGQIDIRNAGTDDWHAHEYDFDDRGFGGDCVYLFQKSLIKSLQNGVVPGNSAREYLRNLEIQEYIYSSSASGTRCDVEAQP